MPHDRRTALRAADKLLRLGKLQPAIAEYTRLADEDPRDWECAAFVATLHLRARDVDGAVARYTALVDSMCAAGELTRAADTLATAMTLAPAHPPTVARLAKLLVMQGRAAAAAERLTPEMAGDDAEARLALIEIYARGGRFDAAIELAITTVAADLETGTAIADLACAAAPHDAASAFRLLDAVVARWADADMWDEAIGVLQRFVNRTPSATSALVRLVDIAVDADRTPVATRAQALLADDYLATGALDEGLAIAEDLAAREPGKQEHAARVQRAQELVGVHAAATVIPFRVSAAS